MAHGYAREYDEGWDRDQDRERNEHSDRERSDRDWRERNDRNRDYQGRDDQDRERGRGWMFGDEDRDRSRDRDDNRGFFSRMRDEGPSTFGEDRRGDRWDRGAWENNGDWPQRDRGMANRGENSSRASSHPDDHYRSWRDRHMEALDRDYQDYCREREQQFHRDFDDWRRNRGQNRQNQGAQGGQSGSQSRLNEEVEYSLEQTRAKAPGAGNTPSPMSEATLGTNNSENSGAGRGRK